MAQDVMSYSEWTPTW